MWDRNDIVVDFVSNKHVLIQIKERFEADYYLHMGDRELDRQFAREAEFEFMWMDEAASEPWIAMKDLEIRGAGNLLGAAQSGHIHAVGFDMYSSMLGEAVEAQRGAMIDYFRRLVEAEEQHGRQQIEEIGKQILSGRSLLASLSEGSQQARHEQPL